MISESVIKLIEYDKILSKLQNYAVLDVTKSEIADLRPVSSFDDACFMLKKTEEAYKLLFTYNVPSVCFFSDIGEELKRVDGGGNLNCGELLEVAANLKSARIARTSFKSFTDDSITALSELVGGLYVSEDFETEITSKILSENEISDNASPKLYSIRKKIRDINAAIREQLNSYIHGNLSKYLQNSVVTMRQERFVIPVKSEYRSFVRGFIHDQSSSGATVFIEPEIVMELNNDLKRAIFDESEEIEKILHDLSVKVANVSNALRYNAQILTELDFCYARAEYAYKTKSTRPVLNKNGFIDIIGGRHPLIDANKVVPVSVSLGKDYNFLLISGPNTGGKTITLKLVGLFTLMAMSGMFVPAYDNTSISFFNSVFCDLGDGQSIEQSLSTFSSHIKNVAEVLDKADSNCLVLIDEIGAGTDPEEGSPLALAVIKRLIKKGCFGIITTHYSDLKAYAMDSDKIKNASMEFDSVSLSPLYKLNIGMPGSSNAISIAKQLGIESEVIEDALSMMKDSNVNFESVLKKAEEERRKYERLCADVEIIKAQCGRELSAIEEEKSKITKERERIYNSARTETKRIVADKLGEAEEIVAELKAILKAAELETKDLFRASELKNRLKNSKYLESDNDNAPVVMKKATVTDLQKGNKVYVKSLGVYAVIENVKTDKNEAEVLIGDIKTVINVDQLYNSEVPSRKKETVKIYKRTLPKDGTIITEINVIGKTSLEAITEVEKFIDEAVVAGLEEVKIIHGVGKGILLKAVREYLKTDKNVAEYRRGRYGEGENGVTVVKLK